MTKKARPLPISLSRFLRLFPRAAGILFFLLVPFFAHAQTASEFIGKLETLLQLGIALLLSAASIIFIWGIVKFIAAGEDPAARKKGGIFILFGIIGIAVILSFWGLTRVVLNFFNLDRPGAQSPLQAPRIPALPGSHPNFPSSPSPPPRDIEF